MTRSVSMPEEAVKAIREGFEHVMSEADAREAARRAVPHIASQAVEERERAIEQLRESAQIAHEDEARQRAKAIQRAEKAEQERDQAKQQQRERLLSDAVLNIAYTRLEERPDSNVQREDLRRAFLAVLDQEGDGDA